MSEIDSAREHLIETYRKRARHYDVASQLLYPFAPNGSTVAGPHKRSGFDRVTAWLRSPAARDSTSHCSSGTSARTVGSSELT